MSAVSWLPSSSLQPRSSESAWSADSAASAASPDCSPGPRAALRQPALFQRAPARRLSVADYQLVIDQLSKRASRPRRKLPPTPPAPLQTPRMPLMFASDISYPAARLPFSVSSSICIASASGSCLVNPSGLSCCYWPQAWACSASRISARCGSCASEQRTGLQLREVVGQP